MSLSIRFFTELLFSVLPVLFLASLAYANAPSAKDGSVQPQYDTAQPWALVTAMKSGDANALPALKARAQKGDVKAQVTLGQIYMWPQEGMKDDAEAFKWWRMAAEQGNAEAAATIGGMYKSGNGTKRDYPQAAQWLRKAAEQGNAHAQNWLGRMYEAGEGVPQDYKEAYFWYLLSEPFYGAFGAWGCLECSNYTPIEENAAKHLDALTKLSVHLQVIAWKPTPTSTVKQRPR